MNLHEARTVLQALVAAAARTAESNDPDVAAEAQTQARCFRMALDIVHTIDDQ